MTSSPIEKDRIVITIKVRDNPLKQKLQKLEAGNLVNIAVPMGEFTLPEEHHMPAVFLSGGIGVTSFRSMIKYVTDKQLALKITCLIPTGILQT